MIYRTSVYRFFEQDGVKVRLFTKYLKTPRIFELPQDLAEAETLKEKDKDKFLGRMSGLEIVEKMMAGELDGGTVGESSFIDAISRGCPITAVAMLGYNDSPGKVILIRRGLDIQSPQDFKGKTLISRRAGPGDGIFLREFIKDIGLDPRRDVKIIDGVEEYEASSWIFEGRVDGGLYHLGRARKLVLMGGAVIYRPMDWMNPALSHALLVFNNSFIENRRDDVQRIVDAYVRRIAMERDIPQEKKDPAWEKGTGLMMAGEFEGMSIASYDLPPLVRVDLINEMKRLLLEYGEIERDVRCEDYVDHSFVEQAYGRIKRSPGFWSRGLSRGDLKRDMEPR
jgi:ABC-type nitrate/sulfonate/bicarbonate transport system substrate-binding protein